MPLVRLDKILTDTGLCSRSQAREIIRRGRNATIHTKAKNADIMTYRHATALEAVIGYLYLYHKSERLELLWQAMVRIGETV